MNHLTVLVKDDFTNLIYLYRKLIATDYDGVAIFTAYDRKLQQFVLDHELLLHFPKITYIGPTPIYEDYVTFANFPPSINLNDYSGNFININIMEHLKTHHLNDIFPAQKTQYHHKLNINQSQFKAANLDKAKTNICINVFDMMYDQNYNLQYHLSYCLSVLQDQFPLSVHLIGIQNQKFIDKIEQAVIPDLVNTFKIPITSHLSQSFSFQLGILLGSNGLISNPFGWGALAYTIGVPAFIIYPFHHEGIIGRTIDPTKVNDKYIETTDSNYIDDLIQFQKLL